MAKRTRKFKTEVQQLLDLVIHSLYSKKEIFLRELISNASDAIDRAKFEALTDSSLLDDGRAWEIRLDVDRDARTLTISDNGIGMTAEEVETNIGTIANSGTRRFLEELKQKDGPKDAELIGRFGVGFYASFMVADEVSVLTRRAGEGHQAVRWTSAGAGQYSLEDAEKETSGTSITLHLRDGDESFLDEWKIREVVKAYSDYIAHPVVMDVTRKTPAKDDEPATETIETVTLNSMKAIWRQTPKDVTPEAYKEFYSHISHDYGDPLKTIHYAAEGATEFRALLFIPALAPFDLFMPDRGSGLHLYVRNVFITNECKALIPEYLRFVRGVVDSSDLPLNVSREMLQDDVMIRQIRKSLVSKVLGTLADMMKKELDDYQKFFRQFGRVIKEGLQADPEQADKLKALLLFPSTQIDDDGLTSLQDYKSRMPQDQKAIYYLTADNLEAGRHAPHLEAFKAKGFEVLLLVDPVDEWISEQLREFDGTPMQAIDRGEIDLGDSSEAESEKDEKQDGELAELLARIQKRLDAHIKEARLSKRLTESSCCLVTDEHAMTPTMERLMRAMNQPVPETKRILEINADHPVVQQLNALFKQDASQDKVDDYVDLLYGQALLMEGSPVSDPRRFASLVSNLMVGAESA
ncbi:MAG: molecular chaperone HtpG [Verrucomicrobia bacterium]|nr:molecular chaperone HtpG [Verrucomicrobiota bacterium]